MISHFRACNASFYVAAEPPRSRDVTSATTKCCRSRPGAGCISCNEIMAFQMDRKRRLALSLPPPRCRAGVAAATFECRRRWFALLLLLLLLDECGHRVGISPPHLGSNRRPNCCTFYPGHVWGSVGVSIHVSRLETRFFVSRSWLSLDTVRLEFPCLVMSRYVS